jgi:Cellulase (glycosyl hydrolase family 5)
MAIGWAFGPSGSLTELHSTPEHAFVTSAGRPVTLRAVNMIPVWRKLPGRTWAPWHYTQIAQKGFNAVRFVLYWDLFEPRRDHFDQTSLATLDTAIARAESAGLYVILDEIHLWGPGGMNDVPRWARRGDSVSSVAANAGGYLKLLARRYRSDPAVAALDLVSEFYRHPIDQNSILRVYDRLIAVVRTADPSKIVLIEPTYGDSSVAGSLANLADLATHADVVWSIHDFFAGGTDTGYSANGGQAGQYTWNGRTGYDPADRQELRNHLLVQLGALARVGLPLWIGEFGIGARTANRDQWIADQVALFTDYHLGWAWWGYGMSGWFDLTAHDYAWTPWSRLLFATGHQGGKKDRVRIR